MTLLSQARCLAPFTAPPPLLTGDFGGLLEAPTLAGFEVADYDNTDDSYSVSDTRRLASMISVVQALPIRPACSNYLHAYSQINDTLTVRFGGPTDKGGLTLDGGRAHADGRTTITSGGTEYLQALFSFSHMLGKAYHGEWTADGSAFEIMVLDTNFSQARPMLRTVHRPVHVLPYSAY